MSPKFMLIVMAASIVIGGGLLLCSWLFSEDLIYYSKKDLINNYEKHSREIEEVKRYVNAITPVGDTINIEFANDKEFALFNLNRLYYPDIKIDSKQTDSLLKKLGWSKTTIQALKLKLNKANCISVCNVTPFVIEWQRSGVGVYSYYVFDRPLNDSLKREYTNGCDIAFYKNNVVLGYEGGTTSNLCSGEFKK